MLIYANESQKQLQYNMPQLYPESELLDTQTKLSKTKLMIFGVSTSIVRYIEHLNYLCIKCCNYELFSENL